MPEGFIPHHGGYRKLLSYQRAEVVYDATVRFCARFLDRRDRTVDQMVQAARSGKQNIIEASVASGHFQGDRDQADQCGAREPGGAAGRLP